MNDFVKDAVEMKLKNRDSSSSDPFKNCTDCDDAVHESMNFLIKNMHGAEYTIATSEKTGKPIEATLIWPENDDEGYFDK